MIEVDQAFLAVWFLAKVFVLLLHYYNGLGKDFKTFSFPNFVNNYSAKSSLMKLTIKHTLLNALFLVKTFLKVTEKNTNCM